ncbi:MAG: DNA polymerase IV [Planctomycetota bacterium]
MILHVDMDAFYASVEEREQPQYRGKPLIVGGSPNGRGVVSAANYAARKYGVHSAMPTSKALKLCPALTVVRPRMSFYAQVSAQIRSVFERYTPEIEPLSLDEAFLDVSGTTKLFGTAEEIGRKIKDDIQAELRLVASVGVAPNKFLAKLASDLEKPNGFTIIAPEAIQSRLDPLSIDCIWGVGRVTKRKFEKHGIHTFGQLRALGQITAVQLFGNVGEHFWKLSQGIDDRVVVSERRAKSVSHETTFSIDVEDVEILSSRLLELTEQVAARLRKGNRQGRTVNLKLRYSDFHTITRAKSLDRATNSTDALWDAASWLLRCQLPPRKLDVRLIGMGVTNLDAARPIQMELFGDAKETGEVAIEQQKLDSATDKVRAKFGFGALKRGSTVQRRKEQK